MKIGAQKERRKRLLGVNFHAVFTSFLLITCTISMPSSAQVYKWVDENGKTHYSDKPHDEKSETVQIQNTTGPDPGHDARVEKRTRLLKVLEEERQETKQNKMAAAAEKLKRETNCVKARKGLQDIKNASFLYDDTDDPRNPVIYSTEARAKATQKAEKAVQDWCK